MLTKSLEELADQLIRVLNCIIFIGVIAIFDVRVYLLVGLPQPHEKRCAFWGDL